jgi:hypothetical protein
VPSTFFLDLEFLVLALPMNASSYSLSTIINNPNGCYSESARQGASGPREGQKSTSRQFDFTN